MKKTFLSFSLVLAAAAPLAAQNINNSSNSGTQITVSTVSGIFGGSNGGGGGSVPGISPQTVTAMMSNPGSLTAIAGGSITVASAVQLSSLLSGTPAQQATAGAAVAGELTAGGAGGAEAVALVKALAGLGSKPTIQQIASAITSFNALVATCPAAMLANPGPALTTAHAALSRFSTIIGASRGGNR
jgi:hypothetical protein